MNARDRLRRLAVSRTIGSPGTLGEAIERLGFVQLDPIRAPAPAQDLILRHRVRDYRVGDLDRAYASLPLAEDRLHVYGVLPRKALRYLHPRAAPYAWQVERERPELVAQILDYLGRVGAAHPAAVARALGRERMLNAWGGQSAVTTRMLEALHYRGRLEVVRREQGVRVYGLAPRLGSPLAVRTRARAVVKLLLGLYAPLPEASLRLLVRRVTVSSLPEAEREEALARVLRSAAVACEMLDGVRYVWPKTDDAAEGEVDARVRLLAPFDPLVWDRRRFLHLWGWDYRFEAYTPRARRKRGYYALPMLWRERIIGWANATVSGRGLSIECGFVERKPQDAGFRRAFDEEIHRLGEVLGLPDGKAL